jgi:Protein of unknown function (DUF2637)
VTGQADRWIRRTTTGCVGMFALMAGTASYRHMHLLVVRQVQPGWLAALTPMSVDAMIVAVSTPLLAEARAGPGQGREHGHGGAGTVETEPVPAGPPGPPATGENGDGQAQEHRDSRQIVWGAGGAGLGEHIGRAGRVAADRVGGEDGRADQPRALRRRSGPPPGCWPGITSACQSCGRGQEQRPCHREVCGLDPAAVQAQENSRGDERIKGSRSGRYPIRTASLEQEHCHKDRARGHSQRSRLRVHAGGGPGMLTGLTNEA